jgi:hypothetical protein
MSSAPAKCALVLALLGWVAAGNERLALVPTTFATFYAYAIPVFGLVAFAFIAVGRSFGPEVASGKPGWHKSIVAAVPIPTRAAFLALTLSAVGYMVLTTGGGASAPSWEAATPPLRSALFVGFTIPALIAWVGLTASARAAA